MPGTSRAQRSPIRAWRRWHSTRRRGRVRQPLGTKRLLTVAFQVAALTLSIVFVIGMVETISFQFDFKGDLYGAGRAIVHGVSPYQPGLLDAWARFARDGATIGRVLATPEYPPPVLIATVPLSLLPFVAAGVLFMLGSVAAIVVALRLLGVKDWRCIAVALISWPAVFGVWLGNLSPLLLFGAAIVWRWRSRFWAPSFGLAAVIAAKLFLWPLAAWLLWTRRVRAVAASLVITVLVMLAGWTMIGFAGFAAYPRMLSDVASIWQARSSSLVSFMFWLGLPAAVAQVAALAVVAVLLGAARKVAIRRGDERRAFGLVVMAALFGAPVVWVHYLVLLYVPIALMSPQLSLIWFVPMLGAVAPGSITDPSIWNSIPELAAELIIIFRLLSPLARRGLTAPDPSFEPMSTPQPVRA